MLAVIAGGINGLSAPPLLAAMPALVGREHIVAAGALTAVATQVGAVVAGDPGGSGFTALGDVEAAGAGVPVTVSPSPSDVAFLQLSGGSTGLSKLIPRTHDD